MVSAKLGIEFDMRELKTLNIINKFDVNKGRIHVSSRSRCGTMINYLESISG